MVGQSKTYDRRINIWINGREVKNDIASIKKEMYVLTNELARTTRGTAEYNEKAKEIRNLKNIMREHQDSIKATGVQWTSALSSVGAGVAAIVGSAHVIKGIMEATNTQGDQLEITLAGWKSGVEAIKRSIATLDFKNFTRNIKEAIDEGRRYAQNIDDIGDKSRAMRIDESLAINELLEQRRIQDDVNKSLTERKKAGEEIMRIEEKLAALRTGIAEQAFKNELDNITQMAFGTENVNDSTREQIKLFLLLDEAFMASLKPAEDYIHAQEEINRLTQDQYETQMSSAGPVGVKVRDNRKAIAAIEATITDEMRAAYELKSKLGIPTDEKLNELTQKWIDLETARNSALQKTREIFTKNSSITKQLLGEESRNITDLASSVSGLLDTLKYNPDSYDNKEVFDKWVSEQIAANDTLEKDYKQSRETIAYIVMEQADKALQDLKKKNEEEARLLDNKVDAYLSFAATMGAILGQAGFDTEKTTKEIIKDLIKLSLDALQDIVWIAIGEATIKSLAKSGLKGLLEAAAITIAIEAAFETAKSAVTSMYSAGGYTPAGGKYEPAGIVHKGEWVANQELVANPRTGPVIAALENYRVTGGRGFADGGMTSSGTPSGSLSLIDPALLGTLDRMNKFLDNLLRDGVKNKWAYKDIDNLRQGISKLENIEGQVNFE